MSTYSADIQRGPFTPPRNKQPVFSWATVVSLDPLRVQLEFDSEPLNVTPDTLANLKNLAVGDRVWCQRNAGKVIILGGSGGGSGGDDPDPEPGENDTMPPASPGPITVAGSLYEDFGGFIRARADLNWSDVTLNADGTPADDISHYDIRWKQWPGERDQSSDSFTPGRPFEALNAIFDRRGKGRGFLGGDGADSVRLPDGRDLWMFGDTAIGEANAAGEINTAKGWALVNNCLVRTNLQTGFFETFHGVNNELSLAAADVGSDGGVSLYKASGTATVGRTTANPIYGDSSGFATQSATAGTLDIIASYNGGSVAVTPGEVITVRARVRAQTTPRSCLLRVQGWNSAGAWVGNYNIATLTNSTTGTEYVGTLTVPTGVAAVSPVIRVNSCGANETHHFDGLAIYRGNRISQAWTRPGGPTVAPLVAPEALNIPIETGFVRSDYWVWPGAIFRQGNYVYSPCMVLRRDVSGGADYANLPGTWLVWWDATTLAFAGSRKLETGDYAYTDEAYTEGTATYLFGHSSTTVHERRVMRLTGDPRTAAPGYWDGAAWATANTTQAKVMDRDVSGVKKYNGEYIALYIDAFSQYIGQMKATQVTGPWTVDNPQVYRMPEVGGQTFCYIPRVHDQFDGSNGWAYGYSQNTSADWTKDISSSGPRFALGPRAKYTPAPEPANVPWGGSFSFTDSEAQISGLDSTYTLKAEVRTVDLNANKSTWTSVTTILNAPITGPEIPFAPSVAPHFQGLRVTWNGLNRYLREFPNTLAHVEVHASKYSNFTPSVATLQGTLPVAGTFPVSGLEAGVEYFVGLIARDKNGQTSALSATASAVTETLVNADLGDDLVEAANIAEGAVNVEHLSVATWSDSLIPNPDFEAGDDAGAPHMWSRIWGTASTYLAEGEGSISGDRSLVITSPAGQLQQWRSTVVPINRREIYFSSSTFRITGTIPAGGYVETRMIWGATEAEVDGWHGASLVDKSYSSTANTVLRIEDNATPPEGAKFGAVMIAVQASNSAPVTVTVGEVEFKKVVGTANIANAAIQNAHISFLDLNEGNVGKLNVGKLDTGLFTADMTVSGRIMTAESGNRVEMNSSGVFGYDSSGAQVTQMRASDGGLVSRWFRTSTSGTRIEAGQYSIGGGSAVFAFHPSSANWLFPPVMGYGGTFGSGKAPGLALHSGNVSSTNYNRYGLSMIGVDYAAGIQLITGRKLDGTEGTEASNIELSAGGAGRVQLDSGTRSPTGDYLGSEVHLSPYDVFDPAGSTAFDPLKYSRIRIPWGYLSFSRSGNERNNGIFLEPYGRNGTSASHLDIRSLNGFEFSSSEGVISFTREGEIRGNFNGRGYPYLTGSFASQLYFDGWAGGSWKWRGNNGEYLSKSFVIDHPLEDDKYLVHACLEGPTADVYYRGKVRVVEGIADVELPEYFEALTVPGTETITVTPVYETPYASSPSPIVSEIQGNKFSVYDPSYQTYTAHWYVVAQRKNTAFEVEPTRNDYRRVGDGPYTYLVKR